ncbi:hypothetical protein LINPERHAP1_LOCUS22984 [Linum perenne]
MGTQGSSSATSLRKLRKDSHLYDEFSYDDDEVRCFCQLRASRRISRTQANPNRKFFGCPLYYSAADKGCDFFLWYDNKIQEDVRKLSSLVGDLTLHLREAHSEKKELEATLDRVMQHSHEGAVGSYSGLTLESYILQELESIKARLSRLEDVVYSRR